ncbi:FHA domain-containing protein [Nocardia sp. NBC_01009]|uniref:FHA domain-containing protein n=1 Tax=Nocardia sp. NBC_01009 TaxID=2975996 RepID=UPI00386FE3E9|nr:FHA domain-containing protein [Nocardia sp. NBC_01009]
MVCPEGHHSVAIDYCDVCGSPLAEPATVMPAPTTECPYCGAPISGRFCEVCGHDSALPAPVPAAPARPEPIVAESAPATPPARISGVVTWVATITADRDFYDRVVARDGPDADQVGFPAFYPERRITLREGDILIGKRSVSQGLEPDIDLGIAPADIGISRAHAMIHIAADGLNITDLGSTNGTSLNGSDELITPKMAVPLRSGDRIHLGGWTTITVSAELA